MDAEVLAMHIASTVKKTIERELTEALPMTHIMKRLDAIEARQPEKGEQGIQGIAGRDGRDGFNGKDGEKGADGIDGVDGKDGKDGIDGVDGKDGIDGLGFDDMHVEYDGERTVTVKFVRGDVVKSFPIRFPVVLDTGVYSEAKTYTQGDAVTFAGSYWIAKTDATTKPGTSDEWRLAVKRGSPGKDGKDGLRGEKGERGTNGLNGRDLR